MYSVEIRDHVMIAHSIPGEVFGPAQGLHGATYVVDAAFLRPQLDTNDIVVDIGLASETLHRILAEINYQNLDEHAAFKGRRSTTEAVARWIHDRIVMALKKGDLGGGAGGIEKIRVTLHESHIASASYEGDVKSA